MQIQEVRNQPDRSRVEVAGRVHQVHPDKNGFKQDQTPWTLCAFTLSDGTNQIRVSYFLSSDLGRVTPESDVIVDGEAQHYTDSRGQQRVSISANKISASSAVNPQDGPPPAGWHEFGTATQGAVQVAQSAVNTAPPHVAGGGPRNTVDAPPPPPPSNPVSQPLPPLSAGGALTLKPQKPSAADYSALLDSYFFQWLDRLTQSQVEGAAEISQKMAVTIGIATLNQQVTLSMPPVKAGRPGTQNEDIPF